jgi:hypothetical protein
MSHAVAFFPDPDTLTRASRIDAARGRIVDAYAPFPLEGIVPAPNPDASMLRIAMFAAGLGVAACAYALEWYSAVIDYPINSGGRPLHSWPAFMMFPFSVGILAAAVCGLAAFFRLTGLPRLHHPVFDLDGFERVSQDRFALEMALPDTEAERSALFDALREAGAISIREIPP